MTPIAIPTYDLADFERLIERTPEILATHPCVVRGFTAQWLASERWTSFAALAERFGSLPVTAGAPQFVTNKHDEMCQVKTDFGTYLRYLDHPDAVEDLFAGAWVKGDAAMLRRLGMPLYCGNLRLVQHAREPILAELEPLVPGGMECLNDDIPYYYQSGNHVWLYVSRAGALTPLHQDNNAVIAYLGQLAGRKEAILFHPDDKPHFHDGVVGYMDPLRPDPDDFPTWERAQPWTASLNPGELLIWGPEWAHHVRTIADSITVSFDIVNAHNLADYCRALDWRDGLGHFARRNAALIRARMPDEAMRAALANDSDSDLGREVMIRVLRAALETPLPERSHRVRATMLAILEDER